MFPGNKHPGCNHTMYNREMNKWCINVTHRRLGWWRQVSCVLFMKQVTFWSDESHKYELHISDSHESVCSRRDEAVWSWSHAIGCFVGVEEGGEWEEEEGHERQKQPQRRTGRQAGDDGVGGLYWTSRCVTSLMVAGWGSRPPGRESPSVPLTSPSHLMWYLLCTAVPAPLFWILVQPSSTAPLSVFSLAPLLCRRTPVSPPPLGLRFCFSHPPTLSQHCTFSTLSSPASSRFYDSV